MRCLVFGGEGMLGSSLVAAARRRGWPALGLSRRAADIRDRSRLAYWVDSFRPGLIVNCAAYTAVDRAEEQPELALAVNGEAVANVAAAAAGAEGGGARLIHLSTDYVFDGTAETPYGEAAATAPASSYGRSKLAGEERALAYERALVVRTQWLFGPGGPSFAATIVRLLNAGGPLKVVDDQVGCPTYTPFLATALLDLADDGAWQPGLLHYRNREPVSWHGFASDIARRIAPGVEIEPVTTDAFPRSAPRPAYSVLDVSRAEERLGRPVARWQDGLVHFLDR